MELQKYFAILNNEVNHQWNYKNTYMYFAILNIEVDHQWNYKNTSLGTSGSGTKRLSYTE